MYLLPLGTVGNLLKARSWLAGGDAGLDLDGVMPADLSARRLAGLASSRKTRPAPAPPRLLRATDGDGAQAAVGWAARLRPDLGPVGRAGIRPALARVVLPRQCIGRAIERETVPVGACAASGDGACVDGDHLHVAQPGGAKNLDGGVDHLDGHAAGRVVERQQVLATAQLRLLSQDIRRSDGKCQQARYQKSRPSQATTLSSRSFAISWPGRPRMPDRISSVCWPRVGAILGASRSTAPNCSGEAATG